MGFVDDWLAPGWNNIPQCGTIKPIYPLIKCLSRNILVLMEKINYHIIAGGYR
jgi:hypothetical protein